MNYVSKTCFGAAYVFTVLSDGFRIGLHDRRLIFSNTVKGPHGEPFEAKWVLGALLVDVIHTVIASAQRDQRERPERASPPGLDQAFSHQNMGHVGSVNNVIIIIVFASGMAILFNWSKLVSLFETEADGG